MLSHNMPIITRDDNLEDVSVFQPIHKYARAGSISEIKKSVASNPESLNNRTKVLGRAPIHEAAYYGEAICTLGREQSF